MYVANDMTFTVTSYKKPNGVKMYFSDSIDNFLLCI